MARIIEFQGKTITSGDWIIGNLCVENSLFNPYEKQFYNYTYIEEKTGDDSVTKRLVIPETIGQYTNIIGKDKKKIYEHDIVSNGVFKGEVYWNYVYPGWRVAAFNERNNVFDTKLDDNFLVIGHKYDELIHNSYFKNQEI